MNAISLNSHSIIVRTLSKKAVVFLPFLVSPLNSLLVTGDLLVFMNANKEEVVFYRGGIVAKA